MKKLILSVVLSISIICSFGQSLTQYIVNAGGSIVIDPSDLTSDYVLKSNLAPMSGDFEISLSSTPPNGTVYRVWLALDGVDISTHDIIVFGVPLQDIQTTNKWGFFTFIISSGFQLENYVPRFDGTNFGFDAPIEGDEIAAGTLPLDRLHSPIPRSIIDTTGIGRVWVGGASNATTTLYAAGSGKLLIGDGTNLQSLSLSGDVTVNSSGVTAIDSVIVDADIKTGAAIKRQKLAAGTAGYVCINSGTGYLTEESTLNPSRGGLGSNVSGSTGFVTFSSGSVTVGSISVDRDLDVNFETGEVGDFKIYMGFPGTLVNEYAYATKVIAGTDNGTIVPKNNAGTTMANGTITFTAADPRGTAYTAAPTTNNTFVAGDVLTFTTAKVTAGGKVHLSLRFTRAQ